MWGTVCWQSVCQPTAVVANLLPSHFGTSLASDVLVMARPVFPAVQHRFPSSFINQPQSPIFHWFSRSPDNCSIIISWCPHCGMDAFAQDFLCSFKLLLPFEISRLPLDLFFFSLASWDTSLHFCLAHCTSSSTHYSGSYERCYTGFVEVHSLVHRRSYLYK